MTLNMLIAVLYSLKIAKKKSFYKHQTLGTNRLRFRFLNEDTKIMISLLQTSVAKSHDKKINCKLISYVRENLLTSLVQ